ncbi:toll-like receptor 3 [Sitophilus oryzae]|uniref:Toll-like receptor 3 n=1 Tax=Sitophilus oryzae TaxID=7048 RepID=A0A6J2YK76_SITOR|nr:toll-like receptor 3 [Sitophilus oryzae]
MKTFICMLIWLALVSQYVNFVNAWKYCQYVNFGKCNCWTKYEMFYFQNDNGNSDSINGIHLYCINTTLQIQVDEYNIHTISIYNSSLGVLKEPPISHQGIFENLRKLDISDNNIIKILPGFFAPFSGLLELNLADNNNSNLIEGVFSNLHKLEILNISNNNIGRLDDHVFLGLTRLYMLDLSNNTYYLILLIKYITSVTFASNTRLEILILNNNYFMTIVTIPESIKSLYVSNNNISEFRSYSNFENLDLSFNKIKTVEIDTNIVNLNLSYNNIIDINITGNIHFLNASHNNLTSVRGLNNRNIERLDLSFNNISEMEPNSFFHTTKLRYINIQHNYVINMPSNIFLNLTSLEYLDISFNLFSRYQHGINNNWANIFTLRSLRRVSLTHNFWICADLKEIISVLHARRVEIINVDRKYERSNILGIECLDIEQNQSAKTFNVSVLHWQLESEISEKVNEVQRQMLNLSASINQQMAEVKDEINDVNSTNEHLQNEFLGSLNLSNTMHLNYLKEDIRNMSDKIKSFYNYSNIDSNNNVLSDKILLDCLKNRPKNISYCFYKLIENELMVLMEMSDTKYEKKIEQMSKDLKALYEKYDYTRTIPLTNQSTGFFTFFQVLTLMLLIIIVLALVYIGYSIKKRRTDSIRKEHIALL